MKKLYILLTFLFCSLTILAQTPPYKDADSVVAANTFALLQYNRGGVNHVFYSSCRLDTLLAFLIRNGAGGGTSIPSTRLYIGSGTTTATSNANLTYTTTNGFFFGSGITGSFNPTIDQWSIREGLRGIFYKGIGSPSSLTDSHGFGMDFAGLTDTTGKYYFGRLTSSGLQGTNITIDDGAGTVKLSKIPVGSSSDSALVSENGVIKKALISGGSYSPFDTTSTAIVQKDTSKILAAKVIGTENETGFDVITNDTTRVNIDVIGNLNIGVISSNLVAYQINGHQAVTHTGSYDITTGNWFFGQAGNINGTGFSNVAVGDSSTMSAIGNGSCVENTAIGVKALQFLIDGSNNFAGGGEALENNIHGAGNTAIGDHSLGTDTTPQASTATGSLAGANSRNNIFNNYYGFKSGQFNQLSYRQFYGISVDAGGSPLNSDSTGGIYQNEQTGYISSNGRALAFEDELGWSLTGNAGTDPSINFIGTTDVRDVVLKTDNVEFARGVEHDSVGPAALRVTDIIVQGNEYLYGNVGGLWRNDGSVLGVLQPTYFTRDTTINVQNGYQINGSDALRQDESNGNISIGSHTPDPASIAGSNNLSIGQNTMTVNSDGQTNVIIGNNSMTLNVSGLENSAIGTAVLPLNTTGSLNSVVGGFAMSNNINGSLNSVVGDAAFIHNISGFANTVLGGFAANNVTTDSFRLYIQPFSEYIPLQGFGFVDSLSHLIYGNADSLRRHLVFNAPIRINDGTQGTGKVLTSDINGFASWQPPTGFDPTTCEDTAYFDNVKSCSPYYIWADSIMANNKVIAPALRISGLTTPNGKLLNFDAVGNISPIATSALTGIPFSGITSTPTTLSGYGITNAITTAKYTSDSAGVQTSLGLKANTSSLATVATSGSYNDLTSKPTIPSASQFVKIAHATAVNGAALASTTLTFEAGQTLSTSIPTYAVIKFNSGTLGIAVAILNANGTASTAGLPLSGLTSSNWAIMPVIAGVVSNTGNLTIQVTTASLAASTFDIEVFGIQY